MDELYGECYIGCRDIACNHGESSHGHEVENRTETGSPKDLNTE